MNERLTEIVSDLQAVSEEAASSFGPLTSEQLNWKPAAASWSIAQCLDHLVRTADEFDGEFIRVASGVRKNTFWQSYSPFTGMAGRFLINAVKNDSKKARAPSRSIVPPSNIDDGIVGRFVSKHAEVIERVESTAAADWKRTVVSSPFLAVMTYTLDDGYTVLVEHSKRHIRQAKRVMLSEDFPK